MSVRPPILCSIRPWLNQPTTEDSSPAPKVDAPPDVTTKTDLTTKPGVTTRTSPIDGFDGVKQPDVKVQLGETAPPTNAALDVKEINKRLLDRTPGRTDDRIVELITKDKTGAVLDGLLAADKLSDVFAHVSHDAEKKLLEALPELVKTPKRAADVVAAMLEDSDSDEHKLAAHHIFDVARRDGYLPQTLAGLERLRPADEVVDNLIRQANPKLLPAGILHRGAFGSHAPENTMEGLKHAVEKLGVKRVEIDLSLTKDDRIVLWHDATIDDNVSLLRNLGLEPGASFRPTYPQVWDGDRKPIHEVDLATVQREFGYDRLEGKEKKGEQWKVPTLDEVVKYAKEHPELEQLALDVKVPPGDKDLHRRFAKELDEVLTRNGISPDRVFLMTPDKQTVKDLKGVFGEKYAVSHDIEMTALVHSPKTTLKTSDELNTRVLSIGQPRLGFNGWDSYLESLRHDRSALDKDGTKRQLYAWTINDELRMREVIGEGVDGIVTDQPFLLERVLAAYRQGRPSPQ